MNIDTANVYFDHPYHAQLDHALGIDFVDESAGSPQRVAIEISAQSARRLVERILAALEAGEEVENAQEPSFELTVQPNGTLVWGSGAPRRLAAITDPRRLPCILHEPPAIFACPSDP